MYKCGDKVTAIHEDGKRVTRIFLGEYRGRFLLVYEGEENEFHREKGAAITYWVDRIEPIETPTIDVGLRQEDIFDLQRILNTNGVIYWDYDDNEGKPVRLAFMREDEMKQRSA